MKFLSYNKDEYFTGKIFTRLIIIGMTDIIIRGNRQYLCRCECGSYILTSKRALVSGNTKSCGCLRKDINEKQRLQRIERDKKYIGKSINGLEILDVIPSETGQTRYTKFKLKCTCGKEFVANKSNILSGITKSCGHLNNDFIQKLNRNKLQDVYEGKEFGYLKVLYPIGSKVYRNMKFMCECTACGDTRVVDRQDLITGNIYHCGCLTGTHIAKGISRHNGSYTTLYKKYSGMLNRCYNKNSHSYAAYGGRGIEVDPSWKECFENFRDWALSNGYKEGLSIERKDPDGNYCPDNCKWIPLEEQHYNKRNTIRTIDGKSVAKFCKKYHLKRYNVCRQNPDLSRITMAELYSRYFNNNR